MCIWDGCPMQPEDETEGQWIDPEDSGDLPWAPRTVDTPEEWKRPDWTGTPEERMYRDLADEDDK
jgi:hypothetical protein